MRLIKAISTFGVFSTLALVAAACGVSTLGGGDGDGGKGGSDSSSGNGSGSGNGSSGNGSGGGGGGDVCGTPNPAGCKVTGCAMGQKCADVGCTSSSCDCDPATNQWACTDDCGGGTCVPDDGTTCEGPNSAGCKMNGCPAGQKCVDEGCTPTYCFCEANMWVCSDDCGGGTCVPENPPMCEGPNPAGCKMNGCPMEHICVDDQECVPSVCSCDPATNQWICTDDCNGGTCLPIP